MPAQDPDLYGQRPAKRQKKKEMALPSSLAFSAELSSLISSKPASSSSTTTTTARARPSKSKPDIFAGVKARRKAERRQDRDRDEGKLVLKEARGTEEEKSEAEAARRKMEEKARLYAAMKRGDYLPKEGEAAPLVDFDRKWAETQRRDGKAVHPSDDHDDDDDDDDDDKDGGEDDNIDTEVIEYTDEFGRTRRGTRAEMARLERQRRVQQYAAEESERMSARPRAPENIIYGDAVQSEAFRAADEDKMEALARKRDRSMTPPEARHYDATSEIRTKGTGFYQFSRDEATRQEEMASLGAEREATERERRRREEEKEERRREVEERRRLIQQRRKEVGEKKAQKMADSFLDGLAADMGGGGGEQEGA